MDDLRKRSRLRWVVVLVAACLAWSWFGTTAHAAPPDGVTQEKTPSWVEPPPEPGQTPAAASGGFAFDTVDNQVRVQGDEVWRYARIEERITNETGLQNAGQRVFSFVPPHERLVMHELSVVRDGETVSHLDLDAFQLLQREIQLESQVYSGAQTAMTVLSDLRVGDVIVYAYSVVGLNPVLDGHYMDSVLTEYEVPVGKLRYRILADRELRMKAFGGAPLPEHQVAGKDHEYTWWRENLAAVERVGSVPPEDFLIGWVQVTDFESWAQVAEWGFRMFAFSSEPSPAVEQLVAELARDHALDRERAVAALRRVQEEVRYFSLSFAESSHRPAPAGDVLARRFGDCKDKSLLLATLLKALGMEARVALVRTESGPLIDELLPSITIFDHAIVVARVEGEDYWLDPTQIYQRGSLASRPARGVERGLILDPTTRGPIPIEIARPAAPAVEADLHYEIPKYDEPGTLTLDVVFRGGSAEAMRAYQTATDASGMTSLVRGWVEDVHPSITLDGDPVIHDDEVLNEVRMTQRVSISELWKGGDGGREQAEFFPLFMSERLITIAPDRRHALLLGGPQAIVHRIRIDLPEVYEIEDRDVQVDEAGMYFRARAWGEEQSVYLEYEFRTNQRRIEVDQFPAYRAAVNDISADLPYYLWHDEAVPGTDGGGSMNWGLLAVGVFWSLLLIGGGVLILKFQPYLRRDSVQYRPDLVGIGGWLILVAIGVTVSPLRTIGDLWELTGSLSAESWAYLTTPDAAGYHPLWAPVLLFELMGTVAAFWLSILVVILFWRKMRSFPLVYICTQLGFVAYGMLDNFLVEQFPAGVVDPLTDTEKIRDTGATAGAIIWSLYLFLSKRARSTFLPPPSDPPSPRPPG